MDEEHYELVVGPPPLAAYRRLRAESGLTPVTQAQAEGAIAHSWTFCHVRSQADGEVVAMGRALGDGGWYFHLADMATLPGHQGRGLGRRVLTWLLDEIDRRAPPDPYVTLNADAPGRPLYRSAGFEETGPRTIAMRLARGSDRTTTASPAVQAPPGSTSSLPELRRFSRSSWAWPACSSE